MGKQLDKLIPSPDYSQVKHNFLQELILASEGRPSSLSFIKHQLSDKSLLSQGIVQGIVIGGTNFILSTEEIHPNGTKKILNRETGILPTFATKERLVTFLSEHLDERADAIGINFGFKLKPVQGKDGGLDGIIQAKGTKDHTFTGIADSVGTIVKNVFTEKYHRKITVSVANDTISLLFSGNGKEQASMVVGTGFNVGLRINSTMLVNLEAGEFNKIDRCDSLNDIDTKTKNPGRKLFEKSVSGMYLPRHFNNLAKQLGIIVPHVLTGQELTAIAHSYHDDSARDLARSVLAQSANLVAAALAGLYEFFDKPASLLIIGEGGLLWDGWHYTESITKQLSALNIPKNKITIKPIKDSAINGAVGLIVEH